MIANKKNTSIVLFDGQCSFCNSSVNFIIYHDKKDQFRFATIQSEIGKNLLEKFKIKGSIDSIILIEQDEIYLRSTAVLRIFKELNSIYPLFYTFLIIPSFIRNFIYDIFAKKRTTWFAKKKTCVVPSKEMQEKFIV